MGASRQIPGGRGGAEVNGHPPTLPPHSHSPRHPSLPPCGTHNSTWACLSPVAPPYAWVSPPPPGTSGGPTGEGRGPYNPVAPAAERGLCAPLALASRRAWLPPGASGGRGRGGELDPVFPRRPRGGARGGPAGGAGGAGTHAPSIIRCGRGAAARGGARPLARGRRAPPRWVRVQGWGRLRGGQRMGSLPSASVFHPSLCAAHHLPVCRCTPAGMEYGGLCRPSLSQVHALVQGSPHGLPQRGHGEWIAILSLAGKPTLLSEW